MVTEDEDEGDASKRVSSPDDERLSRMTSAVKTLLEVRKECRSV